MENTLRRCRILDEIEVDKLTGCWLWRGTMIGSQPTMRDRGQAVHPRRVAYESLGGPLPPGWTLRPACTRTRCVNPAHQRPVQRPPRRRQSRTVREDVAAWLPAERPPHLTDRTWDVLSRLASGQQPTDVAADLGLSRQRIYQIVDRARRRLSGDRRRT